MWRPDPSGLAAGLTKRFGLPMEGRAVPSATGYPAVALKPVGFREGDAFRIGIELGWRSIGITLQPGAFAAPLVEEMGRASEAQRDGFAQLANAFQRGKAEIELRINDSRIDPTIPSSWPSDQWRRVELQLLKSPAEVNTEDSAANDRELALWSQRFLSLALALMPVEEVEVDAAEEREGLPEGARTRVEVNRYERSRINRAACIEIHGDSCKVCGLRFEESYGPAGSGFIHVHHVVPVSQLTPGYRVNPATDLVPLCPNCHSMAHRTTPPYGIDDLRQMLRLRGSEEGSRANRKQRS